jgi:plastocyanin
LTLSPPAATVPVGTTVRWVWTGGPHRNAFEDVDAGSAVKAEPSVGVDRTLEAPGVCRSACAPITRSARREPSWWSKAAYSGDANGPNSSTGITE